MQDTVNVDFENHTERLTLAPTFPPSMGEEEDEQETWGGDIETNHTHSYLFRMHHVLYLYIAIIIIIMINSQQTHWYNNRKFKQWTKGYEVSYFTTKL